MITFASREDFTNVFLMDDLPGEYVVTLDNPVRLRVGGVTGTVWTYGVDVLGNLCVLWEEWLTCSQLLPGDDVKEVL